MRNAAGVRKDGLAAKRGSGARVRRVAAWMLILPIRLYQRVLSPALPRRCRYEPTCSAYAVTAVRRYGVLRGLILAGWRLLRCNPLSDGGIDPVEAQRLFEQRADGAGGTGGRSGCSEGGYHLSETWR